jgi:hypothetical protein
VTLESVFPNLKGDGYNLTSPITNLYNCIAWAANVDSTWWDPSPGYFWPDNVPRNYAIASLKAAFASLGYVECDSSAQEDGFEKVALYADQGNWKHAARMLKNGKWTSKLGALQDIEHTTPEALASDAYGEVVCIMKRATG